MGRFLGAVRRVSDWFGVEYVRIGLMPALTMTMTIQAARAQPSAE